MLMGSETAISEASIIAWVQRHFHGGGALTDDCGGVPAPGAGETLLATSDLMESGRHFRLDWHPPKLLGRKLLAVNLSDLDSSGARPLGFMLTLAVGGDVDSAVLFQILEGLAETAAEYGAPIIGGDTVGREAGLGLGVTAFGAAARWLRRDGALEGDSVYVDAMPGASHRGLRKLLTGRRWAPEAPDTDILAHLSPEPNIGLGVQLAQIPEVHACIDLSDGLCKDLRMMAEASSVSIVAEPDLSEDSLYGGEDYSRCFAAALGAESLRELTGREFHLVARVARKADAPLLRLSNGGLRPVEDRSFDHMGKTFV
jgi:thiamine-monophosphate kinase